MLVKDIMTKSVFKLQPNDNLVKVAKLMQEYDVGCIPVCENDKVVGIVTDRDIVIRNVADGKNPTQTIAKDIMTSNVTVIYPEMNLQEASEIMSRNQIRRLPVIDNNKLVGIVALKDVALNQNSDVEIANTLIDISK